MPEPLEYEDEEADEERRPRRPRSRRGTLQRIVDRIRRRLSGG